MAIWDGTSGTAVDPENISSGAPKCPECSFFLVSDQEHFSYVCRKCGAIYDRDTRIRIGSFAAGKGTEVPESYIPFKISRGEAIGIFTEHCRSLGGLPKIYGSAKILSDMTGAYVPFWLVSSEVEVNAKGIGFKGKQTNTLYNSNPAGDGVVRQEAYGTAKFRLKDIPFDGEKSIPDRIMASAEPFDLSELKEYSPDELKDIPAQKYDVVPVDMTDVIYRRLDKYAMQVISNVDFGFDQFIPYQDQCLTSYRNLSVRYVLLPVWILTLEYDGIRYTYIINGQTGKLSGDFPESKQERSEQKERRSAQNALKRDLIIRILMTLVPWIIILVIIGIIGPDRITMFFGYHPLEFILALVSAILAGVLIFHFAPKLFLKKTRKDYRNFYETMKKPVPASEPDAGVYFDTGFPLTAYETGSNFNVLETGWKYRETNLSDIIKNIEAPEED